MKKRLSITLLYLLPVALLLGCQTPAPQDLHFESIETVKLSSLPGVWNAVKSKANVKIDAVTLLKINFSSQFDFIKLAKTETLNISFRAFTCDDGGRQGQALFVLPDLRTNNFSAGGGVYAKIPNLERFRESNGRLIYHVLMPVEGEELNRLFGNGAVPSKPPFFNPRVPITDICLQVVAAAMWFGPTFESNVVRVPSSEVSKRIN